MTQTEPKLYVKRPIPVAALQYTGDNIAAIVDFAGADTIIRNGPTEFAIRTLEGDMRLVTGSYVIKGIRGEFYPCAGDIFEESYIEFHGEADVTGSIPPLPSVRIPPVMPPLPEYVKTQADPLGLGQPLPPIPKPSLGRVVLFVLDEAQAAEITRRRTSGPAIAEGIGMGKWPRGAQAHIGNPVKAGDTFPAEIVALQTHGSCVNLRVKLDGTDTYWARCAPRSDGPKQGCWHWPPRV